MERTLRKIKDMEMEEADEDASMEEDSSKRYSFTEENAQLMNTPMMRRSHEERE